MEDPRDSKAGIRNDESDSDRKTPSSDAGSLRADTPGVMPKYMYSKVGRKNKANFYFVFFLFIWFNL